MYLEFSCQLRDLESSPCSSGKTLDALEIIQDEQGMAGEIGLHFFLKFIRETGFAGEQAWQHGACSPCMTATPHQFVLFLTG